MRRALTIAAAAIGLFTVAIPSSAQAQSAQPRNVTVQETIVTVRGDIAGAPARTGPFLNAPINSTMPPGSRMYGLCWGIGDFVSGGGVAHDHWVKVENATVDDLWVWGGDLVGNENGNVPNQC